MWMSFLIGDCLEQVACNLHSVIRPSGSAFPNVTDNLEILKLVYLNEELVGKKLKQSKTRDSTRNKPFKAHHTLCSL